MCSISASKLDVLAPALEMRPTAAGYRHYLQQCCLGYSNSIYTLCTRSIHIQHRYWLLVWCFENDNALWDICCVMKHPANFKFITGMVKFWRASEDERAKLNVQQIQPTAKTAKTANSKQQTAVFAFGLRHASQDLSATTYTRYSSGRYNNRNTNVSRNPNLPPKTAAAASLRLLI